MINLNLIEERCISKEDARKILSGQCNIDRMALNWHLMSDAERAESRKRVKWMVTQQERKLQRLWGLGIDDSKHTHWLRFPGLRPKRERKRRAKLEGVIGSLMREVASRQAAN